VTIASEGENPLKKRRSIRTGGRGYFGFTEVALAKSQGCHQKAVQFKRFLGGGREHDK